MFIAHTASRLEAVKRLDTALRKVKRVGAACRRPLPILSSPWPAAMRAKFSKVPSRPMFRSRGQHLSVSAGHVKKPDLLRLRPVEQMDRLGGGLQYYLAALLREISLSLRR